MHPSTAEKTAARGVSRRAVAGTAASVAFGAAVAASMVPNVLAGELSPAGACLLLLGAVFCLLPAGLRLLRRRSERLARMVAVALLCAVLLCAAAVAVLFSVMLPAARPARRIPEGAAVVVPGCLLRGDKPGEMLRNRLDTALGYLNAHPGARCVVTGGYYGRYTQAGVERAYLLEHGVDASRILVDDRSETTYENLQNAKKLLGGEADVVLATDAYHQYRAQFYARELSLRPYALPSKTPARHLPDSWAREFLAVLKARVTGR